MPSIDPRRLAAWLPPLAGALAALVGLVNLVSAVTPTLSWRGHLLLGLEPVEVIPVLHVLTVPAGLALCVAGLHLARRSRRAWRMAFALLLTLGVFNLLKGLDYEEAALCYALAGLLWWGRAAFFRPWTPAPSDPTVRGMARELVCAHGVDTLSFFKLREDKHYLFSADRRAFVGYRIEAGVMLLSGDPVGPEEAIGDLVREVLAFADLRGLKVGGVGASAAMAARWERAGLRTLYLGDEALVDTGAFSLEGRPIRKVRQSVTRLQKAGYESSIHRIADLGAEELAEVEAVVERGREGAPERGFSMAMDHLRGEHQAETLLVCARDGEGTLRGILHFVPCYRRPAMSLSFMRRDRETPNGLTEFLVARAIELLRERGVEQVSLNFAPFARWLHSPERLHEHVLGRLIARFNRFFQIESLYRFNAKFFPRWEPRYLVFQGMALPRTGLAAMWAEGQLPKLRLPVRAAG